MGERFALNTQLHRKVGSGRSAPAAAEVHVTVASCPDVPSPRSRLADLAFGLVRTEFGAQECTPAPWRRSTKASGNDGETAFRITAISVQSDIRP